MELPRTPSFRLDGKRALVTGAGRGIGLAAAAALADAGAEVCLIARTEHEIEAVAEAIVDGGGRASAMPMDVTDRPAVNAFLNASASEVAGALVEAGQEGSIINVSSQMGHVGAPTRTVYCASKHAVEGFTRALAWELGESGIRVNTLCPTFIEPPLARPMLADKDFKAWVLSKIALGRVGQVEDLMGAIVNLASDASRRVTGSALMVDGGWTAN